MIVQVQRSTSHTSGNFYKEFPILVEGGLHSEPCNMDNQGATCQVTILFSQQLCNMIMPVRLLDKWFNYD